MNFATQKTRGKFVRALLQNPVDYYKSQNIELKGNGAWRDAVCPFHKDTKPSLRVRISTGAYRCMACGAHGGDVLAFHQHRHGLTFIEACKQLGAWVEVAK
jgi:DNA primase